MENDDEANERMSERRCTPYGARQLGVLVLSHMERE